MQGIIGAAVGAIIGFVLGAGFVGATLGEMPTQDDMDEIRSTLDELPTRTTLAVVRTADRMQSNTRIQNTAYCIVAELTSSTAPDSCADFLVAPSNRD